jgi:hypothetical protein
MKRIMLNDLLRFSADELWNIRVKMNVFDGTTNPLDEYKENPDLVNINWLLYHKKRRYFGVGQIAICLLKLSYDRWLLTTIKRITKLLDVEYGIGYEAEELGEYSQLFGRVVIKYHNDAQCIGKRFDSIMDELEVIEVFPVAYEGDDFPGYENVRLSYYQLETIIKRQRWTWIAALQNQKAVYLITDKATGKLYVGSATAQEKMLLQRWTDYVNNGHGGNKELKKIVSEKGFDYVKDNFQYSILENYNARMDDNYVLRRESWWKKTLCTKEWGYNCN